MRYALCFFLLSVTAFGQVPSAPMKLGGVTVTGVLRARGYGWDWFEPSSGTNRYVYSGNILRLNFAQSRAKWDWNAELAAPFIFGLPSNATALAPQGALGLGPNYYSANDNRQNVAMAFPRQVYVRFKGVGGTDGSTLQAGRFEFNDATELVPKNPTLAALKRDRLSQRLIGSFSWTDVGRSFDGLRYSYAKPNRDLTLVAATPTRGVFQVDGWGWNRAAFGYAAYTHDWGSGGHAADTRLFALEYDDWRHILKTDNRPVATRRGDLQNIRLETFGGHSVHAFASDAATIDALFWGAVQTGRWGAQTHRAYSFDVEAGIQPAIPARLKWVARLRPWLRGGFTRGSGDDNALDGRHGTFFQVLPTPRPFARFPFFNMMNTEDRFGALILRPHQKWTVSSEFHALRLANSNDLWYAGGGVFQPWTFGYAGRPTSGRRSLGNLYDTSIEFRSSARATFTAYFGYAQGLAAMSQIYPGGKDGKFGYLEALIRF